MKMGANNGYGNFAEFYDRLMDDFDYDALAEYLHCMLCKNGASKGILLDLACGTGILSVMMARRGWDVIGVDVSPEMLSRSEKHSKVSYICQDMTELDLYGTIDAAICSFDGLNHLPGRSALRKAFGGVSLFMNPGGVFIFDMNTVYKHETILGDNIFVKETDGIYCVWRNFYTGGGAVNINLDIFAESETGVYRRCETEITERAYSSGIVISLCEQAGFETLACLDFMTENDCNNKSEKVIFICKKAV
jgi:SAM-dependent methyltransferase